MALGKAAASWRSWVSGYTTSVKVQAFTATKGVECDQTRDKYPVMLRVTAEGEGSKQPPRHVGVDIVAVLDISGSMFGDKLDHMKEATRNVIDKLGPDDRLSIVSFDSNACRLTELTYMSDKGRIAARDKVDELSSKGGTNMGPALHEGAQILKGRRAEETINRVGCIVFLSDGLDSGIFQASISPEFPAHTFGFGDDHDPKAMKYIADKTSGTYSFVNTNHSNINYAFELFIAGITSVAATAVEITLATNHEAGIHIASIDSGGYSNTRSPDWRSGTIHIDNMYAGEKKNFLVYLSLPIAKEEGKQKVLTIGGQYQGFRVSKQLASTDVSVMRPSGKYSQRLLADAQVSAEIARTNLLKEIQLRSEQQTAIQVVDLKRLLSDKDPSQTAKYLNEDYCKKSGLAYMLAWLSCHKWQRATTMDDPRHTIFITPGQKDVKDAAVASADAGGAAAVAGGTSTPSTRWEKIKARARSNTCSGFLPSVPVALSVASMLVAVLYSSPVLQGSPKAMASLGPLQYPMLSESNYPAWAIKMESYMRAQGVWDAVQGEVSTRKNQMALAAIYQAIPEGTLFLLSQRKTAKSAWEALKTMHIGDHRLRDAKLQTLRLEFEGLRMKERESVDDFAIRLTTIVNKIHALGENIEEPYVVKKFLRAVPNKYLHIASTIEQFSDLNTMTLQEVIGRLKVHEERLGRFGAAEKENELLTRAEWKDREEAEWKAKEEAELHDAYKVYALGHLLSRADLKAREEAENHDPYKVYASTAKILRRSGEDYRSDTYRVSSSVTKILDILLKSVIGKEREAKTLLVDTHGDD